MDDKGQAEAIFQAPITASTTKDRRNLLVSSTIAVAVVGAGVLPTSIDVLGVRFDVGEQLTLMLLVFGVNTYLFLDSWFVRGMTAVNWTLAIENQRASQEYDDFQQVLSEGSVSDERGKIEQEMSRRASERAAKIRRKAKPKTRIIIEVALPIGFGLLAEVVVLAVLVLS